MRDVTPTTENGIKRDASGRWLPGTAPANPGGRPKAIVSVITLAREHTELAVQRLVEIVKTGDDDVAARAATVLLSYGWGRPVPLAVEGDSVSGSILAQINARRAAREAVGPLRHVIASESESPSA